MHKVHLTEDAAREFYAVHKDKPFYNELVEFVCSGPSIIMGLAKENAVADWRKLMGVTDPAKAEAGTIRKLFGTSIDKNAVHGSDSLENAEMELSMFFFDEDDMDEDEMQFCDEDECKDDEECCQNDE